MAREKRLAAYEPIKIRGIFGFGMRAFFAILGLLLCLFETHADELSVIKDSEAIQYAGKNVEVRGRVVSVTSSPLGTAFICFGRDYPNQTFAGFIAAGSKIATDQQIATLQGKIIGITGKIELYRGKPEIKVLSRTSAPLPYPWRCLWDSVSGWHRLSGRCPTGATFPFRSALRRTLPL